jgi:peptidylprolyl isomerase
LPLVLLLGAFGVACEQKSDSTPSARPASATGSAAARASAQISADFPPPLDLTAPPSNAQRSSSGLISTQLRAGSGSERLTEQDFADVRFTAWRDDGSLFASSMEGTQRFEIARQIAGLREALTQMSEGEQRRLWLPYAIAFGSMPQILNAPKTALVYDLELIKIVRRPQIPENVAAPPANAQKTASGLRFRILAKGHGTRHPSEQSRVALRYSAFTPDGKMFESSVTGGDTTNAVLSKLGRGWSEGLQSMLEGERRVLWIPGKLANGEIVAGEPDAPFGPPRGPIVIDVELIAILE